MAVLGINSRAASPFKKIDFTVAWVKMAKTRRARIDAENDHRRVTRPRLRIIVKETRGYPTGYLRASSGTIQHGPESREVGYETAKPLDGLWLTTNRSELLLFRNQLHVTRDRMQSYRTVPVDSPLDSPASPLQLSVSATSWLADGRSRKQFARGVF